MARCWLTAAVLICAGMFSSLAASVETNNVLHDIKPPVHIPIGWLWAWRILAALVVIAAAYALWRWRRNRPAPPPPPPVPAHIKARRDLENALALLPQPREFCIRVSDVLRIYLEERFQFAAPERTTEEFLLELKGTGLLNDTQKASLADFLERCDLAKFAKYEPTERELLDLHASAVRLVEETAAREVARVEPNTQTPAQ